MQVTLRPSFTISPSTSFEHHQISKFTNWSSPRGVTRATKGVIVPSSAVNNVKTTSSNARSADMLFTWVIVACIGLGLLMVLAISMGFFYWRLRRRKRLFNCCRQFISRPVCLYIWLLVCCSSNYLFVCLLLLLCYRQR